MHGKQKYDVRLKRCYRFFWETKSEIVPRQSTAKSVLKSSSKDVKACFLSFWQLSGYSSENSSTERTVCIFELFVFLPNVFLGFSLLFCGGGGGSFLTNVFSSSRILQLLVVHRQALMEDVRSLWVRCKTHFSVTRTGFDVGPNLYDFGKHSR